MYASTNFKTKAAFRKAVGGGEQVTIWQPGGFFNPPEAAADYTGKAFVEGPHYPEPHKWYAEVQVQNGVVVKVK